MTLRTFILSAAAFATIAPALAAAQVTPPEGQSPAGPSASQQAATQAPSTQAASTQADDADKPGAKTDLPVKNVVLFSSGVGYFEHYGQVDGNGATELSFKTAQINDILKSLVLQDLDGGTVTAVTYPSEDPIAKTLKTFQIDLTKNPSMADLLNQLRGAAVAVKSIAGDFEGVIIGCEKRTMPADDPKKPAVETWTLNLISGAMLQQVELNKISSIQLKDAKLQEDFTRALMALADARNQDKKPVTINFTGKGERRIRLGYVVETPIWKTSYRLLIADKKEDAKLQGWAIVENQTDNDWKDVQLSLVSGRPISFVQNLYTPLYVPRPVVEPELFASLRPQRYAEGMVESGGELNNSSESAADDLNRPDGKRSGRQPPASAPARGLAFGMKADAAKEKSEQPMDAAASVQSLASASQLGELFQYTVGSVTLERQKSAMIPIVTDNVAVEKLSIYNASVLATHPLNGAMVTNSTKKHLLQGPITVFESGGYAGDAQIDNVPPGQKRLLSFGVDLQTLVDATKQDASADVISGKIVKGVLEVTRKNVFTQTYAVENKAAKEKTLVIEHARRQNWELTDTQKPFETTDALYRFRLPVGAGEKKSLTVTEQVVSGQQIQLIGIDFGELAIYRRTGAIPQPVKDALAEVATRKQAMVDLQRQIQETDQQNQRIAQEQNRIRENMKTVDKSSQYYNRLLGKLNDQESELEKLQTQRDDLQTKLEAARKDLDAYLQGLNVG